MMLLGELRKLKNQKIGFILIMLCFALSLLLFVRSDAYRSYKGQLMGVQSQDEYKEYCDRVLPMSNEDAYEYLLDEQTNIQSISNELQAKNRQGIISEEEKKLLNSSNNKRWVLNNLLTRYEYLTKYDEYLDMVISQADSMSKSPVFAKSGYGLSNILKTKAAYSELVGIELSADAPKFVEIVSAFEIADYIVIMQILIMTLLLFGSEGNDIKLLLRSQYKGRGQVFTVKLAIIILVSIMIAMLSYAILFICGYSTLGGGDFSAPLQSLEGFQRSVLKINVKEYIMLFMVCKIIGAIVVALLSAFFVILFKNVLGVVAAVVFFGVNMLTFKFIESGTLLSPLKYLNPIAWINVHAEAVTYDNMNFFGNALTYKTGYAVFVPFFIAVIGVVAMYVYVKNMHFAAPRLAEKLKRVSEKSRSRIPEGVGLWKHEFRHAIVSDKQWLIILAILCGIGLIVSKVFVADLYEGSVSYQYYLKQVSGEFTMEKWDYLVKEEAYLNETDGYRNSLNKQYEAGELTKTEYDSLISKLNMDIALLSGFEEVYNSAKSIRGLVSKGEKNVGVVNSYMAESYFDAKTTIYAMEIFAGIFIFVVLNRFLMLDYNVRGLVKSTYKGRFEDRLLKCLYTVLVSVAGMMVVFGIYYINLAGMYDMSSLERSVLSLADFRSFSGTDMAELTMKQVLVIGAAFKLTGTVMLALFMYFLSLWNLKPSIYSIISVVALIMPPALGYLGAPAEYILFNGFFVAEEILKSGSGPLVLYGVITGALLTLFGIVSVVKKKNN